MKKFIALLMLVVCCDDNAAQLGIKQPHQKDSNTNVATYDKGIPDQGADLFFLQVDAAKDAEVDQEVDAVVPICDLSLIHI